MKLKTIGLILVIFLLAHPSLYSETVTSEETKAVTFNLKYFIDLSNLEYDDSPYAGRTNIGNIIIPNILIKTTCLDLTLGAWYRHIYVEFDEDDSPEKLYPFIAAIFRPWNYSEVIIGNYENLFAFPNTIYNEFLFFEERAISSGIKISLKHNKYCLFTYLDWLELDTEEHPEEFIHGILWEQSLFSFLYYKIYTHYHHKGGQLHKDTHPVRIEQDIVASPLIGVSYKGFFSEVEYYLSTFSQNFGRSHYGNGIDFKVGYAVGESLTFSYQIWYNNNYYHQDAHIFYQKRDNILNRLRLDYNIYRYKKIIDLLFTVNLYGLDPPGIDFRFFGRINLNIVNLNTSRNRNEAQ